MKTLTDTDLLNVLREVVGGLAYKTCRNIAAGINTGSNVSFDFGKKLRRAKSLRNTHVSQDVRRYTSEVVLFVACSWRLDSDVEVVCGSEDDNSEDGPMMRGLSYLEGRRVNSVTLNTPGLDLAIRFEGELTFHIFCDEVNTLGDDNYTLFLPGFYVNVGKGSILEKGSSNLVSDAQLVIVPAAIL